MVELRFCKPTVIGSSPIVGLYFLKKVYYPIDNLSKLFNFSKLLLLQVESTESRGRDDSFLFWNSSVARVGFVSAAILGRQADGPGRGS